MFELSTVLRDSINIFGSVASIRKWVVSGAVIGMLFCGIAQAKELEEVVVTAQKTTETLQQAGLAVDAVTSDELTKNGVISAHDLTNLVPALTITNGGGLASLLYMRGVGNRANNNYLDPAIITTYDGVPMARGSGASIPAFYDLERVEVLKGPQGTLYGKNATGGVINVIPVKPQLGETSGFITGSYGNYDDVQVSGAFNTPIGENSAIRVAGNRVKHDGYHRDGTQDADQWSIRGQFLTDINDDLNIRIAGDYADIGGVGSGTTSVGSYTPGGLATYTFVPSGLDPNEGQNTPAGNAYRNTILGAPGFGFLSDIQDKWYIDGQMYGINAEINYNTSFGEVTVIPAWRKTKQDSKFGHPAFNSGWWQTEVEQTSVEARLAGSHGELLDYIVGGYYFDESMKGNNTFDQEFVLPLQDYKETADSWAIFGNLTWHVRDNIRLITGARYTDDHKQMNGAINNYITFCGGLPPNLVTPPASFAQGCATPGNLPHYPTLDTVAQADAFLTDNGWAAAFIPIPPGYLIPLTNGVGQVLHSISESDTSYNKQKVTYRVSLQWDVLEDSMLYFSYETGYRSGGLQPQADTVYKPEYLDAYTLGSKNRFMDGRLQLNVELFYWDYTDQQISYFTLTDLGVLENLTDNVGKSTNLGADVDILWLATENTLASAKIQYLKATYDDLHFRTGPPRDNINCPYTIIGTQADGVTPSLDFNCSNNHSIYSPKWTIRFGLQHTFNIGSFNLIPSFDTTWTDDQETGFNNLGYEMIKAHWWTNIDLTLTPPDNKWSVTAYARNLEDKHRVEATQPPLIGPANVMYGPDMTYGVRVNYNFNF